MKKKIVLVTSISPRNIENQQAAITTWIESGFRVVSCNVREELADIERYFPDVEFQEMARGAEKVTGKPCPYIYDMLQVLKEKAGAVCGIINSDIFLKKFSKDLYDYVERLAESGLVFARRQEVEKKEDIDKMKSAMFFGGVDTFFFPKKVIDFIEDDGLILGQAMWDYWFPMMLWEHGVNIAELINPVTFHVRHQSQWSNEILQEISCRICRKYYTEVSDDCAVKYLKDRFFHIISDVQRACYVPEDIRQKQVLIMGSRKDINGTRIVSEQQTHANITYTCGEEMEIEKYDYLIRIPYQIRMSSVFVSALLWIMESYQISAIQTYVYLRGNITGILLEDNCGERMLKHFNQSIEPLAMYRRTAYREVRNGETVRLRPARLCLCSVLFEENPRLIWERRMIEGRVFLFPAGRIAQEWIGKYREVAREIEIKGFVDNNPAICGMELAGLKVHRTEILKDQKAYDKVMVVTELYEDEIYQQLSRMIPKEKIVVWKDEYNGQVWRETRHLIMEQKIARDDRGADL